jgi:predicted nucleic acid-binding protein
LQDEADLYLSAITIGELRRDIENLRWQGDSAQARRLKDWLALIASEYANRILDFDRDCAQVGAS